MKPLPLKPTIKFSDLEKIDVRVGMTVNFGDFKRKTV